MPDTRAVQGTVAAAVSLRQNRGFRLLLTGSCVSMLGSRLTTVAYPLLVLAVTSSPVTAGWACFAITAPSVFFYLPAGALVDRFNPRITMLTCEILRGLILATIVAALLLWHVTVAQLIGAGVIEEILEVFSTLAERRLTRSLVDSGNAATALAQSEAGTHMTVMIGRPLGALLFGAAHALPFIIDSLSFCASIGALVRIKKHEKKKPPGRPQNRRLTDEISEGIDWLRCNHFARVALLLTAGTTLIGQALIMIFLGEAHAVHLGAIYIGIALAASGLGGALGSIIAPWLLRIWRYSLFKAQLTGWLATFVCLALPGGHSFPWMAVAMGSLGFTGALGNIAFDTYINTYAEEAILARVISLIWVTSFLALALGPLIGGVLLKAFGAGGAVMALLIGTVLLRFAAPATPEATADDPLTESSPHYLNGADRPPAGRGGDEILCDPVEPATS
jgi:MFS family permease